MCLAHTCVIKSPFVNQLVFNVGKSPLIFGDVILTSLSRIFSLRMQEHLFNCTFNRVG